MKNEKVIALAEMIQAIAEENRIRIIQCLGDGPKNVTELRKMLDQPLVNVSHHLGILKSNRLLKAEREGRFIVYSLSPIYFRTGKGSMELQLDGCSIHFSKA